VLADEMIQRQKLPSSDNVSDNDDAEKDTEAECAEDERPVVVVLRPGDLTAEEAEQHAALEGQQEHGMLPVASWQCSVRCNCPVPTLHFGLSENFLFQK